MLFHWLLGVLLSCNHTVFVIGTAVIGTAVITLPNEPIILLEFRSDSQSGSIICQMTMSSFLPKTTEENFENLVNFDFFQDLKYDEVFEFENVYNDGQLTTIDASSVQIIQQQQPATSAENIQTNLEVLSDMTNVQTSQHVKQADNSRFPDMPEEDIKEMTSAAIKKTLCDPLKLG